MNILMVCLGNICRSPLAEGIMQSKIAKHKLTWTIDSAGTGAWHVGNPPDPRSQAIALEHGLDISAQRARQFTVADFDHFDLILAMDESNFRNIKKLARNEADHTKVARILPLTGSSTDNVPDPYWDDNGFDYVYQLLDTACERLLEQMAIDHA